MDGLILVAFKKLMYSCYLQECGIPIIHNKKPTPFLAAEKEEPRVDKKNGQ
jgi:hypothetical protein